MRQYDLRLSEYFQEIFDPALSIADEAIFEDSPAGFRLVYKHGRSDPSLWSLIRNGEEYVDCLRDFFVLIEADIASTVDQQLLGSFISDLTTGLVQWIQGPVFLQAAIARSNKNPLYDSGYKTPWDYASGGTMQTFLQGYYSRTSSFTEKSVQPSSEEELLEFLSSIHSKKPLLMHSPTHAFVFQPFSELAFWQQAVEKGKKFWLSQRFSEEMQERIVHLFIEKLPHKEQGLFLHAWKNTSFADTVFAFRASLLQSFGAIKGSKVKDPISFVDSFLYETLPLLPIDLAKEMAAQMSLHSLPRQNAYISSFELQQRVKWERMQQQIFFAEDIEMRQVRKARDLGFAYPEPLLFADTNWAGWYFGWVVGPSGLLELWRLNRTATRGFPMTGWKRHFTDGSKDLWTVLANADEYKSP